jgi:hypothetical protein
MGNGIAQSFDYSNELGWSENTINLYTRPANCVDASIGHSGPVNSVGTITIGNGALRFNNVAGAHENRKSVFLNQSYNELYQVSLKFNVQTSSVATAIIPMALTAEDLNPSYEIPMTVCAKISPMDFIALKVHSTTGPHTPGGLSAFVAVYDEGAIVPNEGIIPLSYDQTYYARIVVSNDEKGNLTIATDSDYTSVVGSFCFDIPRTVNNLKYLQHATNSHYGHARRTTAWVDDVTISPSNGLDQNCQPILGIEDQIEIFESLNLYPNPVTNSLSITSTHLVGKSIISIYNLSGQLVLQKELDSQLVEVSVEHLTPGYYSVHLSNSGREFNGRFIKK